MPGDKALFSLGKDQEPTEKLGQKCELMDRKGQNPPVLLARRVFDGKVDRDPFCFAAWSTYECAVDYFSRFSPKLTLLMARLFFVVRATSLGNVPPHPDPPNQTPRRAPDRLRRRPR
jgi:hypothetical protein